MNKILMLLLVMMIGMTGKVAGDEIILKDGTKKNGCYVKEITKGKAILEKRMSGALISEEIDLSNIDSVKTYREEIAIETEKLRTENARLKAEIAALKKTNAANNDSLKKKDDEIAELTRKMKAREAERKNDDIALENKVATTLEEDDAGTEKIRSGDSLPGIPKEAVGSDAQMVPMTYAENDWSKMVEALATKNLDTLADMMMVGDMFSVPTGTKVKILHKGFEKVHVRIMEGSFEGKKGWTMENTIPGVPVIGQETIVRISQ